MRIVNKEEFLNLGCVAYSHLDIHNMGIGEVLIKYAGKSEKYTYEEFPIKVPDYDSCSNYFDSFDKFIEEGKIHQPVSELETYSDFAYDDAMFVIYSRKDIETWIDKLQMLWENAKEEI